MAPLRSSSSSSVPSSRSTCSTAQAIPVNPEYSEAVSGSVASTSTASSRCVRAVSAAWSERVRARWPAQTARPADPEAREGFRWPVAAAAGRVRVSAPARSRASSLSVPASRGRRGWVLRNWECRDAPATCWPTGASQAGSACMRISRPRALSHAGPTGASSADLGCGTWLSRLGLGDAEHAGADAAVALEADADAGADERVVVVPAAVLPLAAAYDVGEVLVVQASQRLLRQRELLGVAHHRPPRLMRDLTIPDSRPLRSLHKWASSLFSHDT